MTADLIIVNAKALTMDPDNPRAEAVAVAGGKIIAVGSNAAVSALAGRDTRRVDAAGRMLLGTWQGIYLVEHRRAPHRREVVVKFQAG